MSIGLVVDTLVATRSKTDVVGACASHRRAIGLLLVVAALFLTQGWTAITAGFGDSHDGRNAAVWALGSESLREEGPAVSRLGTRSELGGTYANHPPLIYVETALAELLGGSARAATRAPAWLGSLATLVLLTVLLRDAGLRMVSATAGVAVVATTPMFLIYGTMLDTPVTSLPFGIALLVIAQRARLGRHVHPAVVAIVAFLAPLSGWQSVLVTGLVGSWAAVRLLRRHGKRAPMVALAGGGLAGIASLAVWLLWAFDGSIDALVGQFLFRSGNGAVEVGLWDFFRLQLIDVHAMFGFVVFVLAAAGLLLAVRGHHARALAVATLVVTIPYPVVFPVGAVIHDYWDYWFLLPFAVGIAVGFDLVLSALATRPMVERMTPVAVGVVAVLAVIAVSVDPPPAKQAIGAGLGAGDVLEGSRLPPGQDQAWFTGALQQPMTWLTLATGRPAVDVPSAELADLAQRRPKDVVLVGRFACSSEGHITYALETAEHLAAAPPDAPGRCLAR